MFLWKKGIFDGDIIPIPSQLVGSSGIFPSTLLYTRDSKQTLEELLEVRGRIASNKTERVIIAESMEIDQENGIAATPAVQEMETPVIQEEESPANKLMREKLAWFGPNPTPDVVLKVMDLLVNAELQLKLAAVQQAAAPSPSSEYSTADARKIPFSAFKAFDEKDCEIDNFLADFERQCNLHRIARGEWVAILSGKMLSGPCQIRISIATPGLKKCSWLVMQ